MDMRRELSRIGGRDDSTNPSDESYSTDIDNALLRHMVSLNEGFAAAARGGGADLLVWRNGRLGADPRTAFAESAKLAVAAFGEGGALDREFDLPEIRGDAPFPGSTAITFHFVDAVVHAWDVAATIGVPWEPADDLVAAALAIAARVPDSPESRGPGLAYEPGVAVQPDATSPARPDSPGASLRSRRTDTSVDDTVPGGVAGGCQLPVAAIVSAPSASTKAFPRGGTEVRNCHSIVPVNSWR
jgi:uncharacterized protein (TIGR03086 family)